MSEKPRRASGYRPEHVGLVRSTCLYVATILGDLMDDITIVGGLVPPLLIAETGAGAAEPYPGTMDLDLGFTLGVLKGKRYAEISKRLKGAGFAPGRNEQGKTTRQTWRIEVASSPAVTVDFLIPPSRPRDKSGALRNLEKDFAAIIADGLPLAFKDRRQVRIEGKTLLGERAARDVWVCEAGAFVLLKALAFRNRGEPKDVFDLFYVLKHYGSSVKDVVARAKPLLREESSRRAIEVLDEDFRDPDHLGPRRVAEFAAGRLDPALQSDAVGLVQQFVRACRASPRPPKGKR